MQFTRFSLPLRAAPAAVAVLASLVVAACSDAAGDEPSSLSGPARYVLNTVISDTETSLSYVSLLDSLEQEQEIDLDNGREFSGNADTWVYDGSIFVAENETMTITKYSVKRNQLVQEGKISFADYGLTDFGFWVNAFVSPTKALVANGTSEYVVWNPASMKISKTLPFPELERQDGLEPLAGYLDRAVLRDGRLYHPIYWTDDDVITFSQTSKIVVFDIETDEIELLDAACPGLDYATIDEEGTIYFSSWVFAPGGAALYDQPPTCVAKLAAGSAAKQLTTAFKPRDVTEGRDGGIFRYIGNGKALLSVLHPEHAAGTTDDPTDIKYGDNWRFWSYDLEAGTASEIDTIDWNAGAAYSADAGGKALLLVPTSDYTDTTVYDINEGEPEKLFDVRGWAMRLFDLD